MKKYLFIPFIFVFFLSACKKNKDATTSTQQSSSGCPSDNRQFLTCASNNGHTDIVTATASEGAKGITSLSHYLNAGDAIFARVAMGNQPESGSAISRKYNKKMKQFRNTFLPVQSTFNQKTAAGSDAFVFGDNTGTYTWNTGTKNWDFNSSPNDKVIILFPSDTTKPAINDATLTISAYDEIRTIQGTGPSADTSYMPTVLKASLSIAGTEHANIDLTASYEANGTPKTISCSAYLLPYTSTLNYTDGGSSVTIANTLSKDGNGQLLNSSGTINFNNAIKDTVTTVTGFASYKNLKISGSINVYAIAKVNGSTDQLYADALNQYVSLTLTNLDNNNTIGTIEFFVNSTPDVDARVKFTDNTTELASVYFDPITNELDDYFNGIQ